MSILTRLNPDTVSRLIKAAEVRYREAVYLAAGGHHLTAIYLAGYGAEMTIGSAYFQTILGYGDNRAIDPGSLQSLLKAARQVISPSDRSHPIDGLTHRLFRDKEAINPPAFPKRTERMIRTRIETICKHWGARLRYRAIEATPEHSNVVLKQFVKSLKLAQCTRGRAMPVIRPAECGTPSASLQGHLTTLLFRELMGETKHRGPVFFEDPVDPDSINVIVVWDGWKAFSPDDRSFLIREAYSQSARIFEESLHFMDKSQLTDLPMVPKVKIAIGATWQDVIDLDLLIQSFPKTRLAKSTPTSLSNS